jgi:hypothetical protein
MSRLMTWAYRQTDSGAARTQRGGRELVTLFVQNKQNAKLEVRSHTFTVCKLQTAVIALTISAVIPERAPNFLGLRAQGVLMSCRRLCYRIC